MEDKSQEDKEIPSSPTPTTLEFFLVVFDRANGRLLEFRGFKHEQSKGGPDPQSCSGIALRQITQLPSRSGCLQTRSWDC